MTRGRWRVARVPHRCDRRFGMGLRCRNWTAKGEQYWDTGDRNIYSSSPFGTVKLCVSCAKGEGAQ